MISNGVIGIMEKKSSTKKVAFPAKMTRTVDKSADTGRFVSEKDMKAHPKTTYKQTVNLPLKKKG